MLSVFVSLVQAQDVPLFEIADNFAIGMAPIYQERWSCSVADIDRNGWPDLFNTKWHGDLPSQLYLNNSGIFFDIYDQSPDLVPIDQVGAKVIRTPVFVDFDNDGDRDLMIGTDFTHHMLKNDNNIFTDITEQLGIVSSVPGFVSNYGYEMSAWIDWDLDGDLDALVFQTNNPDFIFYRNDGDHFTDIAEQVGLAGKNDLGEYTDRGYFTGRMQWVDWDNDGDPDLCAGYKLFRNEDGYLTEVTDEVGFSVYERIRFADWFDYDNDGDMDYIIQGGGGHDELWKNEGGTFVDATQEVALDLFTKCCQSALNTGDLDNDGDQDVFIQINDHTGVELESLLLNEPDQNGQITFVDVGYFAGLTKPGDRKGSAILDYDMDGWLDIFIPSADWGSIMYHNLGTETPRNWIGFDLWGTQSSRDPLGTLVSLYAGGKKQIRYTKAATSWKIQDNPFVHFGIGQATSIDSVVFRWPMGTVQVLTDPEINQYHKIEESSTGVEKQKSFVPERTTLRQNYPNPFNPETTITYELSQGTNVLLEIYTLLGEKVTVLVKKHHGVGRYEVTWDGKNDYNQPMPSGMYIYRIQARDFIQTKKMIFIQ